MNIYKKTKLIGLLLGLTLVTNTATASLLVEPHIGYNLSASGTYNSHEYSYNGAELGARLGYQYLGLMGGLDYTRSSMSMDDKTTSATRSGTFSRGEFGVFLGYNLPILLRAWGAVYFSSKAKNGSEYFKGDTKELGLGFTGLPFLSVNLMYRMVKWDEYYYNSVLSNPNLSTNEIVLGVSLPLNL